MTPVLRASTSDPRTLLERQLDDAIRGGLVAAGVKGPLVGYVTPILARVLGAMQTAEPTVDEVARDIRAHGGFMRSGDDAVLSDGRHAPPRVLTDALLLLWRIEQPGRASEMDRRADAACEALARMRIAIRRGELDELSKGVDWIRNVLRDGVPEPAGDDGA